MKRGICSIFTPRTDPAKIDKDNNAHDTEIIAKLHKRNIEEIQEFLKTIKKADVWCAWGDLIGLTNRRFLANSLFGTNEIEGLISLFKDSERFTLMAYGITVKGNPRHPLTMMKKDVLIPINDVIEALVVEKLKLTIFKVNNIINKKQYNEE